MLVSSDEDNGRASAIRMCMYMPIRLPNRTNTYSCASDNILVLYVQNSIRLKEIVN